MIYQKILEKATMNKERNASFLKSLAGKETPGFFPALTEIHHEVFSDVDCMQCAHCCQTTPPMVNQMDIKRIARHLQLSPKAFVRQYVLEDVNGDMSFSTVPCVFLSPDNSCRIYDIRPEACRRFPHTDEREYHKRSRLNLQNTIICPAAARIVDVLYSKFNNI